MTNSPVLTLLYTGLTKPDIAIPGVSIVHRPLLEVGPIEFDRVRVQNLLHQPSVLVFYSKNGVEMLDQSGVMQGVQFDKHSFWAVGRQTARFINERWGINAYNPLLEEFTGLVEEIVQAPDNRPIVAFGIDQGPRSLKRALKERSERIVTEFSVYQSRARIYDDMPTFMTELRPDWIAFTSPRAIDAFAEQVIPAHWHTIPCAAIGPTTEKTLRMHGITPSLVMDIPDRNAMVQAIADHYHESHL